MVIFNSYVKLPEGNAIPNLPSLVSVNRDYYLKSKKCSVNDHASSTSHAGQS